MDTNLLRAFIVVAQNLNFTRAAEQLGTTQPLLSRAMKRLEDIIGEELFDRQKRQISLTPSGATLLEEAPAILDREGFALRRAQMAGRGAPQTLRIGYGNTMWAQMLYRGIRAFRAVHPEFHLDFRLMAPAEQAEALRCGEIDAGIMGTSKCDRRDLVWRVIGREPYILALPSDWPVLKDEPVDLAMFRDQPFLLADPIRAPDVHAACLACCKAAGFEPRIVKFIQDPAELRFLVAAGMGAGFVFASGLQTRLEGIVFMPMSALQPESYMEMHLIWRDRLLPAGLRAFIDCMSAETFITEIVKSEGGFAVDWRRTSSESLASV